MSTPGTRCATGPTAMHSMPTMCMGMMNKRPSGVLLAIPGVLLIVLGIAIAIEPGILVWLTAAGAVLLGVVLLLMARRVGKSGNRRHA